MKKQIVVFFVLMVSLLRGQTFTVQNAGNLCLMNHERIASSALLTFQTQDIVFDSLHLSPNVACFLSNCHNKLFIAQNTGSLTTPSYSFIASIYAHPDLYKGNVVSAKFNNDNYVDYALINANGDVITLRNTGFPMPFQVDSMGDSFMGGHTCSKLLRCNIDGSGGTDLVSFGIRTISNPSFVVRPYLNSSSTLSTSLSFSPQGLRTITSASWSSYGFDVKAADLDLNGRDELVFASEASDTVYVIYSSLTGNLDKQFKYVPTVSGITHKKIILSDLNGDGKTEIMLSGITASNNLNYVAIYSPLYILGNLSGFTNFNFVYTTYPISDFNFADLNADGYKDLIISQETPTTSSVGNINVYMQDRVQQAFQFTSPPVNFGLPNHITGGLAVCDVDNNKRPDIISFANTNVSSMVILKNFTYRDSLYAVPSKTVICPGESILLKNQLLGFNGSYLTSLVPTLSTVASVTHSTAVNAPGFYTVQASYVPYVGGLCSVTGNPVKLIQGNAPALTVAGPTVVCGNSGQVILTAGGATSFTWTSSSGSTTASFLALTPSATTEYALNGTSADGCIGSVNGTLNLHPDVNATVTYDKNFLCKGQIANLTASGGATYSWSTNQSGAAIAITQTATAAQTYTVLVTDGNGCSKYVTFSTSFNDKCKDVTVLTGITPNSDGNNDHLYIENIENYPDNVVHIYNRWGQQLYSQKGYDNATKVWPAKEQQPIGGTYYYVLDLGPGNEVRKGWVEVFSN